MNRSQYDKKIILYAVLFLKINLSTEILEDFLRYIDAPESANDQLADQFKIYLQEMYDILLSTMNPGQNDNSMIN